ncbi:MAG: RlmE family RNA methyltransferase [Rhodospirillales bacterium]|nr:RlmE family RNA methyltransferase [Rhodospirillales bacterium]
MAGKRGAKGAGNRGLHTRVKTAKGRRLSSTRWLQRQLNDPYVQEAKRQGYRSRAAFKLIELDDKFKFLKKGAKVIDLGAAPGGWTQVAMARIGDSGHVIGIDLLEMEAIPGADLIQGDFLDDDAPERLKALLGGQADIVLSDMAAASTGHPQTDHLRIMGLLEVAADFAADVLAPGGAFVGKVLQGGTENELLAALKRDFRTVKHAKPPASRSDSAEVYVVATGFRGRE